MEVNNYFRPAINNICEESVIRESAAWKLHVKIKIPIFFPQLFAFQNRWQIIQTTFKEQRLPNQSSIANFGITEKLGLHPIRKDLLNPHFKRTTFSIRQIYSLQLAPTIYHIYTRLSFDRYCTYGICEFYSKLIIHHWKKYSKKNVFFFRLYFTTK